MMRRRLDITEYPGDDLCEIEEMKRWECTLSYT